MKKVLLALALGVASAYVPRNSRRLVPRATATLTSQTINLHGSHPLDHLITDPLIDGRRSRLARSFEATKADIAKNFGIHDVSKFETLSKDDLAKAYEMMLLCRQFENACNQAYMQGHIRGFMHLDNGQESIPALVADAVRTTDIKFSYYREHTHALASGISPDRIMAELFAKEGGTCKGTGGSMHIYDKDTFFQVNPALKVLLPFRSYVE